MADEQQTPKRTRAGRKAPATSKAATSKTREAKGKKPAKETTTARKPRQTRRTASTRSTAPKSGPAPSAAETEAEAAAQAARIEQEARDRAELAKRLGEAGGAFAAKGWSDMLSGAQAMAASGVVARLSQIVAEAGVDDVAAGSRTRALSRDIAAQSLAVAALSEQDLDIGLTLAGIAGQLQSMTGAAEGLPAPVVAGFLLGKGRQLAQLAETVIQRTGVNATLAERVAEAGLALVALGNTEIAQGEARLAASQLQARESEELAGNGLDFMMMGAAEAAEAQDLEDEATIMAEAELVAPESAAGLPKEEETKG